MMNSNFFHYIDLIGTFAFAISGALAAINRNLDIFGVFVISFITACGGGILRDVTIGSFPPIGFVNLQYLYVVILAVFLSCFFQKLLLKLNHPTLFFDALGLGFFATFGTHKTFLITHNSEIAICFGVITAIGGGVLRDILITTIPTVLTKEIYASAALIGASIQLIGEKGWFPSTYTSWIGIVLCCSIRLLSLKFKVNLPSIKKLQ